MIRPNYGMTFPCELHKIRDGDTVVVRLRSDGLLWPIRLIDCWAPETRGASREAGLAAKHHAEAILLAAKEMAVYIPFPGPVDCITKLLTFDRIPGYLFVSPCETLNELMVAAGHATKYKNQTH